MRARLQRALGPMEGPGTHMGANGAPMKRPWRSMGSLLRARGSRGSPWTSIGTHGVGQDCGKESYGARGDALRAGEGSKEHDIKTLPIDSPNCR